MKSEIVISKKLIAIIIAVILFITLVDGWGAIADGIIEFSKFVLVMVVILFACFGLHKFIQRWDKK